MNALLKLLIKHNATMIISPLGDMSAVDIIMSIGGVKERCKTLRLTKTTIEYTEEAAFDQTVLNAIEKALNFSEGNKNIFEPEVTQRDWAEDFKEENGNYQRECIRCRKEFKGHKSRIVCKECHEKKES